jgi:sugar phosphate isomerase/epimerase
MHPRISVSAISSFRWSLDEDLAFYAASGIDNVGVSVAKLERFGWNDGIRRLAAAGLRVTNVIGLGPFRLAEPAQWDAQRERVVRAVDATATLAGECLVLTTGPVGPLTWEEAADALEAALEPVLEHARARRVPLAVEHTNSLRADIGFVHTLRDAIDLARRLDIEVCMEINACWPERGLAATIADGVDRLRLVQLSDYRIGTLCTPDRLVPGDGDIPLERILGDVLTAGYEGCFDLELVGPRIDEEGYESACRRSVDRLTDMLAALGT